MLDAGFGNKTTTISQRRYLGSKTKLLPFIDSILEKEKAQYSSFADIFAGTGVVAAHFHNRADIIVNDILESNHQSYQAFFGKNSIRESFLVKKLQEYNNIDNNKLKQNYFSRNFAGTYFDLVNTKLIGHIREDIEQLYLTKKVNSREKAYLVTSLMYAMDRIANTVGHYDAYRKIEIPKKKLILKKLETSSYKNDVSIHRGDANEFVKNLKADIVYIDPPYNSRQYSDAYHLLENVAEWKKQDVYGVARKMDRTHIKSNYSLKSASISFSQLIDDIDSKYILVSYNDMGTSGSERSQSRISDYELISALERRGEVTVYEKEYNQFTTGQSDKDDLKERIFFCRVQDKKKSVPTIIKSNKNTHLPDFIKSPLNYTGGKHKLLPQLVTFFPKNINRFYDVFSGGANVGINAEAKQIICIDRNNHVVDLLTYIQKTNYEDLNQDISSLVEEYGLSQSYVYGYEKYNCQSSSGLGHYNKSPYMELRNDYNSSANRDKILLFLTLVFYGFNNQIRFNSSGNFNMPVGKRDYNGSSRRNLANFNAVANVKNISFNHGDFRDLNSVRFCKNDFVYLDPPYLLGLASYNESGGWEEKDEYDLYDTLKILNKKGVKFALSNVVEHKGCVNDSLLRFSNSNKFNINTIDHSYSNSNYQSKAKNNQTKEVLITNY